MKFFETSKYHSFKKSTYITLRWIGIIGQFIAVNFVYLFLNPSFDFITSNFIIFLGILSNLYLIYIYKKTQLLVFALILSNKEGKSVKTETIASNIAIPVNTPK